MAEKTAKLLIKQKHDTEANWKKASNFRPEAGELIVYDADSTHSTPRFKVGDGTKLVNALPFVPSSDVTANPSGAGTTSLTKIEIDGTVYTIPSGSPGITIPSGTSATAMLFGDNTWKEPIKINGNTFKLKAGGDIYAPEKLPVFSLTTPNRAKYYSVYSKGNTTPRYESPNDNIPELLTLSTSVSNASYTISYDIRYCQSVVILATTPNDILTATINPRVAESLTSVGTGAVFLASQSHQCTVKWSFVERTNMEAQTKFTVTGHSASVKRLYVALQY